MFNEGTDYTYSIYSGVVQIKVAGYGNHIGLSWSSVNKNTFPSTGRASINANTTGNDLIIYDKQNKIMGAVGDQTTDLKKAVLLLANQSEELGITPSEISSSSNLTISADNIHIKTSGNNTMSLAPNGKVGIGTTTPTEGQLHVHRSATMQNFGSINTANAALKISESSNANMYFDGNSIYGSDLLIIGTKNDKYLALGTNNTEQFRMTGTGDIGIGTHTPSEKLDVNGRIRSNQSVDVTGMSNPTSGTSINMAYNTTDDYGTLRSANWPNSAWKPIHYQASVHIFEHGDVEIGNPNDPTDLNMFGNIKTNGTFTSWGFSPTTYTVTLGLDPNSSSALLSASQLPSDFSLPMRYRAQSHIFDQGKVGIGNGIVNPACQLHIQTDADNSLNELKLGKFSAIDPLGRDGDFPALYGEQVLRIPQRVEFWGGGSGKQYIDVRDQQGNAKIKLDAEGNSYIIGNVGIGTLPQSKFHIRYPDLESTSAINEMILQAKANGSNNSYGALTGITFSNWINGYSSDLKRASGVYGINLDNSNWGRYMGLAFYTSSLDAVSTEKMRIDENGKVGIGCTPDNSDALLFVNGNIRSKGVYITDPVTADFVFEEDYDLRPIEEVETFVKENKHLPEIPSAKEMEDNGVDMVELNGRLLQKVEELTLYIIEQNKQMTDQNKRLEQLEKLLLNQK